MYTPPSVVATIPNVIKQVQFRLQQQTLLIRFLAITNLIVGGWYLGWRMTASMHGLTLWLGMPLLLAEIYSYGGVVLFFLNLWQRPPLAVKPKFPEQMPRVDVLIRGEQVELMTLEKTLRAALALDYPAPKLRVYLVSRQGDPALVELSQRLAEEEAQTPVMQKVAQDYQQARSRLCTHQTQLNYLLPTLAQAKTFLNTFCHTTTTNLDAFSDLLGWFDSLKPDDVPIQTWLECQTALSEAFTNAVEHAHRHQPPTTPIEIQVAFLSQAIQFQVFDYGLPFDFQQALADLPTDPDIMAERGRGLSILQQLADDVTYTPLEDGRNCFVFLKSYTPTDIGKDKHTQLQGYLTSIDQGWQLLYPQTTIYNRLLQQQRVLATEFKRQEEAIKALSRCHFLPATDWEQLSGDFLLLLDGEQIPQPQFLRQVLPYFYDPSGEDNPIANRVSFVQTSQRGDNLFITPESSPDLEKIESGFAVGTNSLLRRKALTPATFDYLLAHGNHSLDLAMELHQEGWESVYHDEVLAEAWVEPDGVSLLKQELERVQERLQGLFQGQPWHNPKLSFWQQFRLLQLLYRYGSGLLMLIFLVCPILYSFGGILPVDAYNMEFLARFIPAYGVTRLSFWVATWGIPAGKLWQAEQNAIALFPIFLQAFLPSLQNPSKPWDYCRLVLPQLLLITLTLLGLGWSTYQYFTGGIEGAIAYRFNTIWASYNILLLGGILPIVSNSVLNQQQSK